MIHTDVKSSIIKSIGHNPDTNIMEITFKTGKTYSFENVTKEKHEELMNAKSVGKFFHAHIKPFHRATKNI